MCLSYNRKVINLNNKKYDFSQAKHPTDHLHCIEERLVYTIKKSVRKYTLFCYNDVIRYYEGDFRMYVNERDQINYHGFLRALREMHKLPQECVSKGICSKSGMNRFENGNRVAEKLMRDRLTARLGISGEKYEDYLQPREYVFWEQRLRIVKAIEKRDLVTAKKELSAYEQRTGLNRVNLQFVEAMRYMILSLEDASKEELESCVKKAVKCTVSKVSKALEGAHLLADQEINLIAEQMRLSSPKTVIRDVNTWRVSEYEKLISYMDASKWEKLQLAKVYPKVVYYICQLLLENETTEAECRRGLELCHTAIELLRDTSRLYYFIELTESRRELVARLSNYGISADEKSQLEEMLTESNEWEKVFKELYTEYKVAPYMSDFCYLYYETECHNMATVIETRRNMLGLSRAKLSDNICAERTIIRLEREDYNPSIDTVRNLFERMGMCAEYRRAPIIVQDANALRTHSNLISNFNALRNEAAEECLHKLITEINMDISYNEQEVERFHNIVEFRKGNISKEELQNRTINLFQKTLPFISIKTGVNRANVYLTRAEVECVYDIAFYGKGEMAVVCKEYIEQRCNSLLKGFQPAMLPTFELLETRWASELGDHGDYTLSNFISTAVLKECLSYRKTQYLAENIYNIAWNNFENGSYTHVDNVSALNHLEKCILISNVIKDNDWTTFFQTKVHEIKD